MLNCTSSLPGVRLMTPETPELRPEALCALTNIASTECTRAIAQEPNAIPTLKALLSSPNVYLREQVLYLLMVIRCCTVSYRFFQ